MKTTLIGTSLKFVPNSPTDNQLALVQIMDLYQTANKSEPMIV